jgi:hypothetical protein
VHPTSNSFSLDPNVASTHGIKPRNPSAINGEIHIGYDPAAQAWTFNLYSGGRFVTSYLQIQSSAPIAGLVTSGITAFDGPLVPVLLMNMPGGMVDRSSVAGLGAKVSCVSGVAADFDNDMYMDIYLACRGGVRNISNILLHNNGNGTFTAVPNAGGAAGPIGTAVGEGAGVSESVDTVDYDLDGRVDLFVTNGLNLEPEKNNFGPEVLLRNTSPMRNWIELDLVGTNSNRDAIGARVYATAGGVTQYREQNEGYHRWSQSQRRTHFGLAGNTTVNLVIKWPSGRTDTYNSVAADHIYVATEGGGIRQANY